MQYDETKDNEENRKIWILIIAIIIIILLCFYFITFGKVTFAKTELIPTGNVDIFDLNIGSSTCEVCQECQVCDDTDYVFEEDDEELKYDIVVYDDIDFINHQVNLRIFDKPAYEYDNKIAPGSYNSYQFIVRNNNLTHILYNLKMVETNIYGVNMKYRLKLDGEYVIGSDTNWVYASDLEILNLSLIGNSYHTYNLDWKWFDNDNDTYVGENAIDPYKLDIIISAKADDN